MSGMEHISAPLGRAFAALNPHSRTPLYEVSGRRIIRRGPSPRWLSLDEAGQEAFTITAAMLRSDDPGELLPLLTQLIWAVRDAREGDADPTPPAANAMAVPEQRAAA